VYFFSEGPFYYILDPSSMMLWREKHNNINKANSNPEKQLFPLTTVEKEIPEEIFAKIKNLTRYGFFQPKGHSSSKKLHFEINNVDFIVLNPNTFCNLNCWYCYVDKSLKEKYKEADFNQIIHFLEVFLAQRKSHNNKPLAISCCYTNEITKNFDIFLRLYKIVENLREKNDIILFLPSTNLFEISDDFIEFINSYGYLAVSIDLSNKKQIETVTTNLSFFDKNVIKHCHATIQPLMSDIYEKYFFLMQHFDFVSMKPVRLGYDRKLKWDEKSLLKLDYEMRRFVNKLLELTDKKLVNFLLKIGDTDYFTRYLKRIFERKKVLHRCPAGITAISFGPDNKIYPCSGLTGSKYSYGEFVDGKLVLNNLNLQRNVKEIRECNSCPIRYYCGGPCLDWLNKTQSKFITKEECKINKIFFKSAAVLAFELLENRKSVLEIYRKKKEIKLKLNYDTSFSSFSQKFGA